MHWLDTIKDNMHLFLGGAASIFIYKDKIDGMSMFERAAYIAISIGLGVYGGDALIDICNVSPTSPRALFISNLVTIFGLAVLGLFRDNIALIFSTASKLIISWFKKKLGVDE